MNLTHEKQQLLTWMLDHRRQEVFPTVYRQLKKEEKIFVLLKATQNYKYHHILFEIKKYKLITKSIYNKTLLYDKLHYIKKNHLIKQFPNFMTTELALEYLKSLCNKSSNNFMLIPSDSHEYMVVYILKNLFIKKVVFSNKKQRVPYRFEEMIYNCTNKEKKEITYYISKNVFLLNFIKFETLVLHDMCLKFNMVLHNFKFNISNYNLFFYYARLNEDSQFKLLKFFSKSICQEPISKLIKAITDKNSMHNILRGTKKKILNNLVESVRKINNPSDSLVSILFSDLCINEKIKRIKRLNYYNIFSEDLAVVLYFVMKHKDIPSLCAQIINIGYNQNLINVVFINEGFFENLSNDVWKELVNIDYKYLVLAPKKKIKSLIKMDFKTRKNCYHKNKFMKKEENEQLDIGLIMIDASNIFKISKDVFEKNIKKIKEFDLKINPFSGSAPTSRFKEDLIFDNRILGVLPLGLFAKYCIWNEVHATDLKKIVKPDLYKEFEILLINEISSYYATNELLKINKKILFCYIDESFPLLSGMAISLFFEEINRKYKDCKVKVYCDNIKKYDKMIDLEDWSKKDKNKVYISILNELRASLSLQGEAFDCLCEESQKMRFLEDPISSLYILEKSNKENINIKKIINTWLIKNYKTISQTNIQEIIKLELWSTPTLLHILKNINNFEIENRNEILTNIHNHKNMNGLYVSITGMEKI